MTDDRIDQRNDRYAIGVFLTRIGGEIASTGGRCYHADLRADLREDLRDTLEQAISRLNAYEQTLAEDRSESITDITEHDVGEIKHGVVDAIIPDDHKQEIAAGVADFMAFRDARGGV